jgi:hypothetical protein
MEEYVFPNNWYIEITDENKEVLNAWKINQFYSKSIDSYDPPIKYINNLGADPAGGGWLMKLHLMNLKNMY